MAIGTNKVTDPALLSQLNAPTKKVTDPSILAQLNGQPQSEGKFGQLMKNSALGNALTGAEESGVNVMQGARWLGEKLYGPNVRDEAEKAAFDAANKKLESQEGPGVINFIARAAGDPLNYIGGAAIKEGKLIQKASEKIGENVAPKSDKFVFDLVSPKQTQKVMESQVPRTTQKGILGTKIVSPNEREKEIIGEVSKLPVSRYNSLQKNYNIIRNANIQEATKLDALLAKKDFPLEYSKTQGVINKTMQDFIANSYNGSTRRAAIKQAAADMNTAILNNLGENGEITVSGLLKARREFDLISKRKMPSVLNSDLAATANRNAVREMRQTINEFIESEVPDAGYKASLKRQSLLYDAMENIQEKAPAEGNNIISRNLSNPTLRFIRKAIGQ